MLPNAPTIIYHTSFEQTTHNNPTLSSNGNNDTRPSSTARRTRSKRITRQSTATHRLAHTAILGLPRVKVHERGEGLAKDGERYPKYAITQQLSVRRLHLFQRRGKLDHGDLEEHS